MNEADPTLAQRIADAANRFRLQMTGHEPKSVSVVLSDDVLVITFHDALAPAEMALAKSADGAASLKEFHRELFDNSNCAFRRDIKGITGREVRAAAVEIDAATGSVVHVFTTDAKVQIYFLSTRAQAKRNGDRSADDQLGRAEDDGLHITPDAKWPK